MLHPATGPSLEILGTELRRIRCDRILIESIGDHSGMIFSTVGYMMGHALV